MYKFPDIQKFLFDEYLYTIQNSSGIERSGDETILWESPIDVSSLYVNPVEYNGFTFGIKYTDDYSSDIFESYIISPNHFIVSQGGRNIKVYAETEMGYQVLKLAPKFLTTRNDDWVGEYYKFSITDFLKPEPSEEIKYEIEDDYYHFIRHNIFKNRLKDYIDPREGRNLYFRKDSLFIDWFLSNYNEKWFNWNKDFNFIGNLFPDQGNEFQCTIFRYLLNDYVINSIPDQLRNENITKFMEIAFDRNYSKIYNMTKDLKSLVDVSDMFIEYSENISDLYNIDLSSMDLTKDDSIREVLFNMPILLKKKGTHSSILSFWRIIAGYSENNTDINIYEWWHEALQPGQYQPDNFYEINFKNDYLNVYDMGCTGESYYQRYSYDYPNYFDSDITKTAVDAMVHMESVPVTESKIYHNLNSDKMTVQCIDMNLNVFFPSNVIINNESECTVEFKKPFSGYILLCKPSYSEENKGKFWDIDHYINKKTVINQYFTHENYLFQPASIYMKNKDLIDVKLSKNTEGYGNFLKGDFIFYNLNDQVIWNVVHNSGNICFIQVYDKDDNIIFPKSIKHVSLYETEIEFNKPTNGYVVIKVIGELGYGQRIGNILSPHYKVEMDLTCKPISSDAIISYDTANNLYKNFEMMRPVHNVSHYHTVFSPSMDFSGHMSYLYDKKYDPRWGSVFVTNQIMEGAAIFIQYNDKTEWNVDHFLKSTEVIPFFFDFDYNQIYPENTKFSKLDQFSFKAYFDSPQSGFVLITVAEKTKTFYKESDNFVHNMDKRVLSHFLDFSYESIFPANLISEPNEIKLEFDDTTYVNRGWFASGNYVWEQNELSDKWVINHNYKLTGVISQFYDSNWNQIIPDSLTLKDVDICEATFSEPISGYAVLREIGSIILRNDVIEKFNKEGVYVKLGNENYTDSKISESDVKSEIKTVFVSPESGNIYKYNNDLIIDVDLYLNENYNIKEIGIFDKNMEKMYFYSSGSDFYKHPEFTTTLHIKILYDYI